MSICGDPVFLGGGGGAGTIISKDITQNGTYNALSDNADGYNPVIVDVSPDPAVPSLPATYQEVEYVAGDGNSWVSVTPPVSNGVLCVDAEQDDLEVNSMICGYRTGATQWYDWNVGSAGSEQRWYFRNGGNAVDMPATITLVGKRITSRALILFGGSPISSGSGGGFTIRPMLIGNYYATTGSAAYGPIKGKIFYVRILNPGTNTWAAAYVPCYRKADNVVGFYDVVNSAFYINAGSGSFTAGPDVT